MRLLPTFASASTSITSRPSATRVADATPTPCARRRSRSRPAPTVSAHLREDRRHIRDDDIARLKAEIAKPLNLEMAATEEMVGIAVKTAPHAACLVPGQREERTTEADSTWPASTMRSRRWSPG